MGYYTRVKNGRKEPLQELFMKLGRKESQSLIKCSSWPTSLPMARMLSKHPLNIKAYSKPVK
jgi:hypothetical protein